MYFDNKPCAICGSEVDLVPRTVEPPSDAPVGPAEGFVGEADVTVDERVCTNPECPSNQSGQGSVTTSV
jgi:hypothetical protein